MNKKGMTLIELIAVIAIIAILSLMIAPNIMKMRNDTIVSSIDNKIIKIENAAINYAEDNLSSVPNEYTTNNAINFNSDKSKLCMEYKTFEPESEYGVCEDYCLIVYISTLVEQGYLAGDNKDKTEVIHPLTGENLNYDRVCVRYDTNVVTRADSSDDVTRKLVAYIVEEAKLYEGLD